MPRSSHSAEAGHSEAGFAAFGPQEKGGNVRNILTQHSPTPRLLPRIGVGGGLI